MPTYRAQITIPYFSLLPGDITTNTIHFDPLTPLGFQETADLVDPLIAAWFEGIYGGVYDMATYMLPNAGFINWYDLSEPPPRVPYRTPMDVDIALSTSIIPTEVAMVLSFQAPAVSGEPQARRRGRIYLGGLTSAMLDPGTGAQFPRFNSTFVNQVATATETFIDAVTAAGVRWTVWSQVDQASAIITNGWIDNSPDTQRRRSVDPTSGTVWAETP